jgi:TolB-like protein
MSHDAIIEFGAFRLSPSERSLVSADGSPIQLTRRLFDTLLYMVERPGRLLEKQTLLDAIWGGVVVEENTLSRTISGLRHLLGDGADRNRYIETVSGVGYRFVQSVKVTRRGAREEERATESSIAVLPFEDLSRERDQEHFADGIAEEVLNRLASVRGLRVIAKSSSFRFRGRDVGAKALGRKLGVAYLLMGSVRKENERFRVNVQLVEATRDSQVWSEHFDRALDVENLFALQDDISRAIFRALGKALGVEALVHAETFRTEGNTQDLEAYDLYLRGKAMMEQTGGPAAVRSVDLFRAALGRDRGFAGAWHALADATLARSMFDPKHTGDVRHEIDEAVDRTVALAPNWWAAHTARGLSLMNRRDWLGHEQSIDRATELAPGMPAPLNRVLGTFYSFVREPASALEQLQVAARVDPLSMYTSALFQINLLIAGRLEEADAEYRRSVDLPGDPEMVEHIALHRLWARGAPFNQELHLPYRLQLRRYLDRTQTDPAPILEEVYVVCDDPRRVIERLRAAAAAPDYQTPLRQLVLSSWLAAYGDSNTAFEAAWRGYVEMGFFNVGWLWFPVLKPVRAHARFPELLSRVGLTEYWRAKGRMPAIESASTHAVWGSRG